MPGHYIYQVRTLSREETQDPSRPWESCNDRLESPVVSWGIVWHLEGQSVCSFEVSNHLCFVVMEDPSILCRALWFQ